MWHRLSYSCSVRLEVINIYLVTCIKQYVLRYRHGASSPHLWKGLEFIPGCLIILFLDKSFLIGGDMFLHSLLKIFCLNDFLFPALGNCDFSLKGQRQRPSNKLVKPRSRCLNKNSWSEINSMVLLALISLPHFPSYIHMHWCQCHYSVICHHAQVIMEPSNRVRKSLEFVMSGICIFFSRTSIDFLLYFSLLFCQLFSDR